MLLKKDKCMIAFIHIVAGLLLIIGWREFLFLTDDAYISFRYISNSLLGHGYVWNAAPFKPVEGYSNFLWMLLLEFVWRTTSIEPPVSSHYLSLLFSYCSLLIASKMILKLEWSKSTGKYKYLFVLAVFLGVLSNRTFLAWTSSGLETAMFNFFVLFWIYSCIYHDGSVRKWNLYASSAVAAIYLTRPDGLLFLFATIAMQAIIFFRSNEKKNIGYWATYLPYLLVLSHLLWRLSFYKQWLPNTYYAKQSDIWPESGIKYATSFILEYAVWIWMIVVLVALFYKIRKIKDRNNDLLDIVSSNVIKLIVILTVFVQLFYYTIFIGGDHFEYRVYSYLVVPIFVSLVWAINAVSRQFALSVGILFIYIILAGPVQWSHWYVSKKISTFQETKNVSISHLFPESLRWYTDYFDQLQFWLTSHLVCIRHQGHKLFTEQYRAAFPSREERMRVIGSNYPVAVVGGAGIPGWVLPHINLIDSYGLNDSVIARNKKITDNRQIAHERTPPPGYIEEFSPNVRLLKNKKVEIVARKQPLTADQIRAIEKKWFELVTLEK